MSAEPVKTMALMLAVRGNTIRILVVCAAFTCFFSCSTRCEDSPSLNLKETFRYIVKNANENNHFIQRLEISPGRIIWADYMFDFRLNDAENNVKTLTLIRTIVSRALDDCPISTNVAELEIDFSKIDPNTITCSGEPPPANTSINPTAWTVSVATSDQAVLKERDSSTKDWTLCEYGTKRGLTHEKNDVGVTKFWFYVDSETRARRIVNAFKHATILAGGTVSKPDPFDSAK